MNKLFDQKDFVTNEDKPSRLELTDGSRVAVMGGGPAGSFYSYFFLDMAAHAGMNVEVDILEPRDFSGLGPASCNMCGGIISETLVQNLAAEGIKLPTTVIQRGVDSYVLHTDVGSVRIDTPLHEKRIGSVYRASGPRGIKIKKWESFDGFLQKLAVEKGARLVQERVEDVRFENGRPQIKTKNGEFESYDLLVVAVGVNSPAMKILPKLDLKYQPPQTVKTFIREYHLGEDVLEKCLGSSMHVFLLNIPGLEFAAIIPKGDCASVCLLGNKLDNALLKSFLESPEVRKCMPADWEPVANTCQCAPKISVQGAVEPFADRIVFIGDAGVTRLYKDGIGAAYRTSKAAAATSAFQGISAEDFRRYYWPTCRSIEKDNDIGKLVFSVTHLIQNTRVARSALIRMVANEQKKEARVRRMSTVMWDMFTGSATYREVFKRTLHPAFLARLFYDLTASLANAPLRRNGHPKTKDNPERSQ